MRFERLLLVVNPVARTYSKATLAVIEKALSADFRLEVAETKERGHALELGTQAVHDGIDLVVVFSGDGTVNEVVNALAGTRTALAALPGGATNILVRSLDLPLDPIEATGTLIGKALDDHAFKLSLGRADGRYFAVNCGAGVDAAAMRRLDAKFPRTKADFDRVAFRAVAWELLVRYAGRTADLQLRIDDGEPVPSLSVMVGRTDPYTYYKGRGLRMTPDASLDSGLDVLCVREPSGAPGSRTPTSTARPNGLRARARRGAARGCTARTRSTHSPGRTAGCAAGRALSGTSTCRDATTSRPG